jgi:transposase-like protein
MDTISLPEAGRQRRRYSAEFKSNIVAACLQPGVSVTAIALANKINPNLVRRWVRLHQESAAATTITEGEPETILATHASPALVPIMVAEPSALAVTKSTRGARVRSQQVGRRPPAPPISVSASPPDEAIRLEFRRGNTLLNVSWPAMLAESCAQWLRELLR